MLLLLMPTYLFHTSLPDCLNLADLLAAAAIAPWPDSLQQTVVQNIQALKREVRGYLEPLRNGVRLPPLQFPARPAIVFDLELVPHGLVAVARNLWHIDVANPGSFREFLDDTPWTGDTFLPALNHTLGRVDPLDHSIQWLQRQLHLVLWFPNTRSPSLPSNMLCRFPALPAEPGIRGTFFLMYAVHQKLGIVFAFWEPAVDGTNSELSSSPPSDTD